MVVGQYDADPLWWYETAAAAAVKEPNGGKGQSERWWADQGPSSTDVDVVSHQQGNALNAIVGNYDDDAGSLAEYLYRLRRRRQRQQQRQRQQEKSQQLVAPGNGYRGISFYSRKQQPDHGVLQRQLAGEYETDKKSAQIVC